MTRLVNEIDMLDSAINRDRVRILAGPALTDFEVTCLFANIARRTLLNKELEDVREHE
jgi:hypothetical protein